MEIQPLTIMTTTDDEILKPQVEKKKLELSLDLDLDTHHHQSRIGSAVISQPPTPAPVLKHQSMSAPSSPVKQSQFNARMKHSWLDQLRELIPSAQDLQKSEKKQEPSPPRQPPLGARRRSLSDSSLLLVSQRNNKNDNHQLELSQILSPEPGSPASRALMKANSDFRTKHKIRHKRMRIGKKKLGRTNYRRPKGAEINAQHEQYALTYGMMSGILNSVGAQNPFKLRLSMNDFMRVDKRTFASNNGKLENPFKFKDYSPDIFRQIRRRFSIDSADYMLTLCGDFNYIEFISNSKSGQFFFYSHDGRFMIKTQTKAESKFLRRILPHYYKFAMENPNTLVTKFYGMHRVKMHHLRRKMHFVIMASVFDTPKEIHQRFDLKGSFIGRQASPKERANPGSVLKDLDLLQAKTRVCVGPAKRAMLLEQLRKDVAFLKQLKIMDYSLLLGVHDTTQKPQPNDDSHLTYHSPTHTRQPSQELETRPARSISMPEPPMTTNPKSFPPSIPSPSSPSPSSSSMFGHDTSQEAPKKMDEGSYEDSSSEEEEEGEEKRGPPPDLCLSPRSLDTERYSTPHESVFCEDEGGIRSETAGGRYIYYLGVIDILQQYNSKKIAETFFKGFRHNRKQISAVNPNFYGDRFIEFMEKHVLG